MFLGRWGTRDDRPGIGACGLETVTPVGGGVESVPNEKRVYFFCQSVFRASDFECWGSGVAPTGLRYQCRWQGLKKYL